MKFFKQQKGDKKRGPQRPVSDLIRDVSDRYGISPLPDDVDLDWPIEQPVKPERATRTAQRDPVRDEIYPSTVAAKRRAEPYHLRTDSTSYADDIGMFDDRFDPKMAARADDAIYDYDEDDLIDEHQFDDSEYDAKFPRLETPAPYASSKTRTSAPASSLRGRGGNSNVARADHVLSIQTIFKHIPFLALVVILLVFFILPHAASLPLSIPESFNWYLTSLDLADRTSAISASGQTHYQVGLLVSILSAWGDTALNIRIPTIFAFLFGLSSLYFLAYRKTSRDMALALAACLAFACQRHFDSQFDPNLMVVIGSAGLMLAISAPLRSSAAYAQSALSIVLSVILVQLVPSLAIFLGAIAIGVLFDEIKSRSRAITHSVSVACISIAAIALSWMFSAHGSSPIAMSDLTAARMTSNILSSFHVVMTPQYFPWFITALCALLVLYICDVAFRDRSAHAHIGFSLSLPAVLPLLAVLLFWHGDRREILFEIFASALLPVLLIAGITLYRITVLKGLQFSFLALLMIATLYSTSSSAGKTLGDIARALDDYNATAKADRCVYVYPEAYQYVIWYGMHEPIECYQVIKDLNDIKGLTESKSAIAYVFLVEKTDADSKLIDDLRNDLEDPNFVLEETIFNSVSLLTIQR